MYNASLSTLATDAASKLNVLRHDRNSLSVDGTQVGIFKQADEVSFARFLQRHDGAALKAQVSLEVLGDFAHQTLEWELANQQLGRFLVSSDFAQRNSPRSITMRLLHASSSRSAFASSLGRKLLARGFATGRFSCGLLCSCHCIFLSDLTWPGTRSCAYILPSICCADRLVEAGKRFAPNQAPAFFAPPNAETVDRKARQ